MDEGLNIKLLLHIPYRVANRYWSDLAESNGIRGDGVAQELPLSAPAIQPRFVAHQLMALKRIVSHNSNFV